MAIGINPKYKEEIYLDKFNAKQYLVLALEAVKLNGWKIELLGESGFIAYTDRGKFKRNFIITFKIHGESATVSSKSKGSEIIDWGHNKWNVEKFCNALIDFKYSMKAEELDKKYEELQPSFSEDPENFLNPAPTTLGQRIHSVFLPFIPGKGYIITPVLVNINILLWLVMIFKGVHWLYPDNESLLTWGSNFRPLTLNGEWWRLISNCFVHIGVIHLLMNMYALIYIGLLLEHRVGSIRFLTAYLLTGIIASMSSLCWHDLIISAGASGAIFGMYGLFLAMLTTNLIEKDTRKSQLASIGVFVMYNLIYGLKGEIDNAAHIGGLIGGILIGYAYFPSLKRFELRKLKYASIGILTVIVLGVSFLVYINIPNDIPAYEKKMEQFAAIEKKALLIYDLSSYTPRDKLLREIKDHGIFYWNENIKLLNQADSLDLPDPFHERNKQLINYCKLRIQCYNLMYRAIDEQTDMYRNEIRDCTIQIENQIHELTGQ